jgi:hypothetical protein
MTVVWNGSLDRQGKCFSLTGRLEYRNDAGTDAPVSRSRGGGRADRKANERWATTYAKAKKETS